MDIYFYETMLLNGEMTLIPKNVIEQLTYKYKERI